MKKLILLEFSQRHLPWRLKLKLGFAACGLPRVAGGALALGTAV
jgi:hypothetical protein